MSFRGSTANQLIQASSVYSQRSVQQTSAAGVTPLTVTDFAAPGCSRLAMKVRITWNVTTPGTSYAEGAFLSVEMLGYESTAAQSERVYAYRFYAPSTGTILDDGTANTVIKTHLIDFPCNAIAYQPIPILTNPGGLTVTMDLTFRAYGGGT